LSIVFTGICLIFVVSNLWKSFQEALVTSWAQ